MSDRYTIRLLFFISGATALAYEVVWMRWLTLTIGVTTFCVAVVVAAFLGGLSLGALFFGRRIDRGGSPLRTYAWLEVGVGSAALALHFLLPSLEWLYVFLHREFASSLETLRLLRLLVCFAALLPPTMLMGGTLPVLCRREVSAGEGVGSSLAALYALNTLGGVAGTLLTGFLLIPSLGLTGTVFTAVAGNLAAAGVALAVNAREARREAGPGKPRAESGDEWARRVAAGDAPVAAGSGRGFVLAAAGLAGFVALSAEVIWTRALDVFLRSGIVYSFTVMLSTFLLGIALGSWMIHKRTGGGDEVVWLSLSQIGIGAWGPVSVLLLTRIGSLPAWVQRHFGVGEYSWGEWSVVWMLSSAGILLIPCLLMGIAFPLWGRLVVRSDRVGSGVGWLYAANGAGSVLGAAATGFLLIPRLGTLGSLRATSFLSLLVAAIPLVATEAPAGRRRFGGSRALALAVIPAAALFFPLLPDNLLRSRLIASRPGHNLYFAEGAVGLTEIYERLGVEGNSYRKLYFNGTSYAGTTQNGRRYHQLLGSLPALLHPDPRTGLVIGFGSGMTFSAMMADPRVLRVDCVELASEVLGGAEWFAADNGDARHNPKGRVFLGDGRQHLLVTPQRYDLISLEPPPPRFTGVVNLYSRDFYRLCRDRLRPGGLMTQWIPMHSHTVEEMRNLIRSFVEVFPESTFWIPTQRDGILVGSTEPIRVTAGDLRRRMAAEPLASSLREIDVPDLGALLGALILDAPALAEYVRNAHPITDDRPTIEYFAGHLLIERPEHVADVMRHGINPADWLEHSGGGDKIHFSADELHHAQAMQQLLLGVVAGDLDDVAGKKEAYARALALHPDSVFLRRLNQVTGTPEE